MASNLYLFGILTVTPTNSAGSPHCCPNMETEPNSSYEISWNIDSYSWEGWSVSTDPNSLA